jgi:hypothetical protein
LSNPAQRGKYASEAKVAMTMAQLEKWMALEIAGRYHQQGPLEVRAKCTGSKCRES